MSLMGSICDKAACPRQLRFYSDDLDHRLFCNASKDSRGLNPGPRNGCEIFQPGSPKVKRLHILTRRMIHPVRWMQYLAAAP
jgi:hypothetical protein